MTTAAACPVRAVTMLTLVAVDTGIFETCDWDACTPVSAGCGPTSRRHIARGPCIAA
jgi:hypothetical protein